AEQHRPADSRGSSADSRRGQGAQPTGAVVARQAGKLAQGAKLTSSGTRPIQELLVHNHPCGWKRRDFLKTASALALGLGLEPHRGLADDPKPAAADVGIARGSNMEEAVRRAVRLAGGMDFIKEGQTVLIKPNVTGAVKSPTTTNPEVLYATIKLAAERGPKRIIVSDRCFSAQFV